MNSPAKTEQPAPPKTDIASLLDEPPWQPWWRRWTLWLVLALVLAAAAGFYVWRLQVASAAAPRYSTEPVTRGKITLTVTANGSIQPTRSINIGSELSGTVRQVLVDVNDQVRKGQVLLVLDTAKLRDQILRSQAAEASARGRLAQALATVGEANASQARMEEVARLSGGKVPSKAELEAGRASVSRAVADEAIARAGVKDAQAALSTDQTNLSKASIVAPSDGILLTRSVDPGNAVAASLQAVTLFTLADDLHKLRVWVYVDEADVGAVKLGQAASFTVSAYPTREFPARVSRVGQGSTITDNVVTYLTYLDVDNADLSLRPGMTATATITATERQDVLQVPNTALRFAPSNDGVQTAAKTGLGASLIPRVPGASRRSAAADASTAGARQVWVLPADAQDGRGTPVAVAVMPGISDGHLTEITRGDLQLGQQVITDQKTGQAD
jgi:HlyD family secretion protein